MEGLDDEVGHNPWVWEAHCGVSLHPYGNPDRLPTSTHMGILTASPWMQIPYSDVACDLAKMGLRSGWGKNVGRIREMVAMLRDILQVSRAGCIVAEGAALTIWTTSDSQPTNKPTYDRHQMLKP